MSRYFRSWMDEPMMDTATGLLNEDYARGIVEFMTFVGNQQRSKKKGTIKCPCSMCRNNVNVKVEIVWNHLYSYGFTPGYKIWYLHGEKNYDIGGPSEPPAPYRSSSPIPERHIGVGMVDMVNDAFIDQIPPAAYHTDRVEEPNLEAQRFFDMLDAAKQPLYSGCGEGHSPLSSASRMMNIKTDYNLSEECVDAWAEFVKDVLPEDNMSPASYYEIQKLVAGLGLPYQMIDVCPDNCMIYWRGDENRKSCRFCRNPRYKDTTGRISIPFKRMWYLPLTDRLKRLYQSDATAEAMRWHAEHHQSGEITHPSDAEAWKHFQSVYPDFATESRNVYLGLCTDGFNPFGKHGRKYSLWPVIVTPYNLPPSIAMRREYLFLSVLVPGPDHPRRSLDIFLQPLIYELQMLWDHGVDAYDVSLHHNFKMRAVLMWTISDFPAYGMLSGWTTHGRLSCLYCQENTNAFQLKNSRKSCWFDCHRRFLPVDHPYRRSRRHFSKNKQVLEGPPPHVDGKTLVDQLRDFGAERTPECGGCGHEPVGGAGYFHNWHKKSIFWDLPYWKDHLLRHCVDVMHVEKNFFDNLMNTIMNVKGKTKDNLKSRLDLPLICSRESLHVTHSGKFPMAAFRLDAIKKEAFLRWIQQDVRFTDGYASNLRNCVDFSEGKLTGLKSHDYHVIMQRLLPFAFAHLLNTNIHHAIAGIAAFFRDLCSRSLTVASISTLEANIPVILCNLEKIFPPSFFDVMEHLPIHLPREAALGGPVQYRWMYPFERYMFYLKKQVKNLSRVEGSVIAQSLNAEVSNFSEHYFPSEVSTKRRRPARHDDRGEKAIYPIAVPPIFSQVGRVSGKGRKRKLSEKEARHLHQYILSNCEEIMEYERMHDGMVRNYYPGKTEDEIQLLKEDEFAMWLKFYVSDCIQSGQSPPTWLLEMCNGLNSVATSYPRFCSRGYAFRTHTEGESTPTADYGISAKSGDVVYYGILKQILVVRYPGLLDLRCTVFMCDWYDPTVDNGVRVDQFGVISINTRRSLNKFDPFILASQADQVSYIPYPRVTYRSDPWITVHSMHPRGVIYRAEEHDALQESTSNEIHPTDPLNDVDLVVQSTEVRDDRVYSDSEEYVSEFGDDANSMTLDTGSDCSE